MRVAYLDYNATAPVWPEVRDAMAEAMAEGGNPSAVHRVGRAARRRLEDARETVAALLGAEPGNVIFTASGSEANTLALRGLAEAGTIRRIVLSALEHPSVVAAAEATGLPLIWVPVDRSGALDPAAVAEAIGPDGPATLVCLMAANNETGVVQPVADVVEVAHEAGALVHCDAVQALGRLDLTMDAVGVDLLTVSAHKIGGPPGVGALVLQDDLPLRAQVLGGGQERRRRAGTENTAGIAGFAAAAQLAPRIRARMPMIARLRDALERALRARVPAVEIFGAHAPRLGNTSCFAVPGLKAELQVMALDLAGVAVSAGAACSSGRIDASPVLTAMGAGPRAGEAIRVSLGWHSNEADIDQFLHAFDRLLDRRAGSGARRAMGA